MKVKFKTRYLVIIVTCLLITCGVFYYKYSITDKSDNSDVVNFGISISNYDYNSGYYKLYNQLYNYINDRNDHEYNINFVVSDSLVWNDDYTDKKQDLYNQYLNIVEMIESGADYIVVGIDNSMFEKKIVEYCNRKEVKLYLIEKDIEKRLYDQQVTLANELEYKEYIYIGYNEQRFNKIKNNLKANCIEYIKYDGNFKNLTNELENNYDRLSDVLIMTEADSITYDLLRILNDKSIDKYKIISVGGNDYIKSKSSGDKEIISIDWDYDREFKYIIELLEEVEK